MVLSLQSKVHVRYKYYLRTSISFSVILMVQDCNKCPMYVGINLKIGEATSKYQRYYEQSQQLKKRWVNLCTAENKIRKA